MARMLGKQRIGHCGNCFPESASTKRQQKRREHILWLKEVDSQDEMSWFYDGDPWWDMEGWPRNSEQVKLPDGTWLYWEYSVDESGVCHWDFEEVW